MFLEKKKMKKKKIFGIKRKKAEEVTWSQYEDELLLSMEKKFGSKWCFMSLILKNKSKRQCFSRFNKLNPKFKKGKFTQDEDEKIIQLVENFGKNWKNISKQFPTRTSKQIRSRYTNYIDKQLDNSKITEEEIIILKENFPKYGNSHSKYIKLLPKSRSCRFIRKNLIAKVIPFL